MISEWYTIPMTPFHTPRPRMSTATGKAYNTREYKAHKQALMWRLTNLRIPKYEYNTAEIEFFFPFPKSIAKKNRIHNTPKTTKPDIDNLAKGILDALEQINVIKNDSQIHTLTLRKRYTTYNEGFYNLILYHE